MDKKPLVSIVVPVYNCEKYIDQCIRSLMDQTYGDLEIICVNDGSPDSSLEHLETLQKEDDRIQVYSKENEGKGAASARNMGLDHATGEYVLVLDSDDFFEPDMVEVFVSKAEETGAEVVITTASLFDNLYQCEKGICLRPELKWTPEKEPFSWRDCPEKIFQIADFVAWNKLFRRDFLEKNNIRFEAIAISDDQYPSVMGAVLAERIAVINRPLIHYRMNTGSSQGSSQARHPEAAYEATFSVVKEMRRLGIYESVKRSYVNLAIHLMRQYFDRMDKVENIRFLYDKYLSEIFPFLGADKLTPDYFYDERVGSWYELVTTHSLEEILFMAARGSGTDMTTASLRFRFPVEQVERGSNIAIVGKGIAGRYWYSQAILSEQCNRIYWVASEDEIPSDAKVDRILKAR